MSEQTKKTTYPTPQHAPGETQFQPNNKQAFMMTTEGIVRLLTYKKQDWATRTLLKALARGHGAKSVMQKVERVLREKDKKREVSTRRSAPKSAPVKTGPVVVHKK